MFENTSTPTSTTMGNKENQSVLGNNPPTPPKSDASSQESSQGSDINAQSVSPTSLLKRKIAGLEKALETEKSARLKLEDRLTAMEGVFAKQEELLAQATAKASKVEDDLDKHKQFTANISKRTAKATQAAMAVASDLERHKQFTTTIDTRANQAKKIAEKAQATVTATNHRITHTQTDIQLRPTKEDYEALSKKAQEARNLAINTATQTGMLAEDVKELKKKGPAQQLQDQAPAVPTLHNEIQPPASALTKLVRKPVAHIFPTPPKPKPALPQINGQARISFVTPPSALPRFTSAAPQEAQQAASKGK